MIIMPIAFENIGWKVYIINALWDVLVVVLIVSGTLGHGAALANKPQLCFQVGTKGKTLEEIDSVFDTKAGSSSGHREMREVTPAAQLSVA